MNRTRVGLLLLMLLFIGGVPFWSILSAGAMINRATSLSGAGGTALGSVTLAPGTVQADQATLMGAEQNFSAALSLLNVTLAIEPAQQRRVRSLTPFSSAGLEIARAGLSFLSGDHDLSNLGEVLGQGRDQDLKPALLETRSVYDGAFANLTAARRPGGAGGYDCWVIGLAGPPPQAKGVAGTDRYKGVVLLLDGYDHLVTAIDDRAEADATWEAGQPDRSHLALMDAAENLQMADGIFSGARDFLAPVVAGQAGPEMAAAETMLGKVRADQQKVGTGV